MRRILRKIAEDDFSNLGDISTLADPAVVEDLIQNWQNNTKSVKVHYEGRLVAVPFSTDRIADKLLRLFHITPADELHPLAGFKILIVSKMLMCSSAILGKSVWALTCS